MAIRPHDVTDLYLAPVVLAVDARIEKLGRLGKDGLAYEVALDSDSPDFTRRILEDGLIRTVTHLIDCHGWEFSWDPRGLRLTHDAHTFVLGIPAAFLDYLEDSPGCDAPTPGTTGSACSFVTNPDCSTGTLNNTRGHSKSSGSNDIPVNFEGPLIAGSVRSELTPG